MDYIGKKVSVEISAHEGEVIFEKDSFVFMPKDEELSDFAFRINYKDITGISSKKDFKSTVIVSTSNGPHAFYMYKLNTFVDLIRAGMDADKVADANLSNLSKEELDKISNLSNLHRDGVITRERMNAEKEAILASHR